MSETTGAPGPSAPTAAPAAAPTGQVGSFAPTAPPATSQPGISVSEAARLLNRQRRQGAEGEAAAPAADATRKPSPSDVARQAQASAESPAAAKAPPAPAPASALERALGAQPQGDAPATATETPDGGVEIEGQRLRTAAEIQAFVQRKSADYTQKMQGLAAERQQVHAQAQQIAAQQQALATVLPYIQPELARLQHIVGQEINRPDPSLAQTDPQRYIAERAQYENALEEQQRLGNLNALQSQAQARAMEAQVNAAHEQLSKEVPGWADPQQRTQLQHEIVQWATRQGGFSENELRGLSSPHHFKTMMKAAMYDRMVEGAKSSAPPQRTLAPVRGAPPPPAPSERIQVAEQAFGDKANIRTAAALLAARRANGHAR